MTEPNERLSEHDLEVLHNLEAARHFQDMMRSEGWKLFLELKDKRVEQVKKQFFSTDMDKDALWASQIRLKGIEEFMDALVEGMNNAVECLNPQVLGKLLRINRADYEGEIGLEELP